MQSSANPKNEDVGIWNGIQPRTGSQEGPNSPSEHRDLPYFGKLSGRNRDRETKLHQTRGPYQGSEPKFSPFGSRMRAGQTFPLCIVPIVADVPEGLQKRRGGGGGGGRWTVSWII